MRICFKFKLCDTSNILRFFHLEKERISFKLQLDATKVLSLGKLADVLFEVRKLLDRYSSFKFGKVVKG